MWFFARRAPQQVPETQDKSSKVSSMWSDSLGRAATRAAQIILVLIIVAGAIFGMTQLTLVIIPVLLALIFASAFEPVMRWMRDRGVPSLVATILALLAIVAALTGVGWLITWQVRDQWETLYEQAQQGVSELIVWFQDLPFTITEEQFTEFQDTAVEFLTSSQFGSGALAGVSAAASFFTGLVLMIVVLFFFLKDGPQIWQFLLRPFQGERYERAERVGRKTVETLGSYVRGTATVAAVDALGILLGLLILGWVGFPIPLAIPLALLVFVLAFIPLVGATLAGTLAALVAFVAHDIWIALVVIGIVVLVNQIEGNFLQPVVMGRTLKLHALVVLVALTIGTVLAGIVGAVLAVPIAAVAWGIIQVWDGEDKPAYMWRQKRRESMK
ncbi:AI-2E family transporter [uncultured Agrococcus sp.]|uniref:AI-2E family transporter n=1 Tax=uncultured Agrococcus sp. TaxID=382258 RepID=UPI0025E9E0BE|nr:AI-2E family transporter [uncultured Agrococcus sp.]